MVSGEKTFGEYVTLRPNALSRVSRARWKSSSDGSASTSAASIGRTLLASCRLATKSEGIMSDAKPTFGVSVVTSDVDASLAFYRALGVAIPDEANWRSHHVGIPIDG